MSRNKDKIWEQRIWEQGLRILDIVIPGNEDEAIEALLKHLRVNGRRITTKKAKEIYWYWLRT